MSYHDEYDDEIYHHYDPRIDLYRYQVVSWDPCYPRKAPCWWAETESLTRATAVFEFLAPHAKRLELGCVGLLERGLTIRSSAGDEAA